MASATSSPLILLLPFFAHRANKGKRAPSPHFARGAPRSSLRDREERFRPVAVLLRPSVIGAPGLVLGEPLLGVGELVPERARVEVLGRDRLLDQEARPVPEHLQPAGRLRVA